ncbi:MAG: argininosuccinate lyase [Chloroflexota bacterium]
MSALWGGRFSGSTAELMKAFNDSIGIDIRLWEADITGSIAYAKGLSQAEIISPSECDTLISGLAQVRDEFEAEQFQILPSDEDIHTAVERRLKELVGDVAGKLHTGRSRNDQVATDTRLWLRDALASLRERLLQCIAALVKQAEEHIEVILPGYTHLQQAQPIRFSHLLLSYAWKLDRDLTRLDELVQRVNVLPLGSGALAGNPIGVNRQFLAQELRFASVSSNSLDAVADRDFIAECLGWAAMTQVHLSSLAEDFIIYSSSEFGFIELDDAYSTGSSLMPQKKNPDSLELVRGKTGRVIGNQVGFLTTLKGLPSTYNKDLQEDKEPLFDTVDTMTMTLSITTKVVETLQVRQDQMYAAMQSHLLATELADYLVSKDLPFRQAHDLVGKVIQISISTGQPLWSIPLQAYQSVSSLFERDVHAVLDFERAINRYDSQGGSAIGSVVAQIETLQDKHSLLDLEEVD